jgi:hypothetical protein
MRPRLRRFAPVFVLLAGFVPAAFSQTHPQAHPQASAQAVEQAVHAFMLTVEHDVTHDGPTAWRRFFSHGPRFFMASDGHLVFPSYAAADKEIGQLTSTIKHIDLSWGNEMRIDPLSPDLAEVATPWHEVRETTTGRVDESGLLTATVEYQDGHWQFRDLHWSVAKPAGQLKPAVQ